MSAATESKAARLLSEGRVDPDPTPARIFRVDGDSGRYVVFVSAHHRSCTCPHGEHGGEGDCSHVSAAVEWVLSEGALMDETRQERPLSARALRFPDYLQALADRKARDSELADEAFRRLGA